MAATQVLALAAGGRKEAVARVQVIPGTGTITVNGRPFEAYFPTVPLQTLIREPLAAAGVEGRFDIVVNVSGGGISGQAGAVRHGIARALLEVEEGLRAPLRKGGFLTRDSREKERKKYGRKRARKGFQYSKR